VKRCDTVLMECTYGKPHFVFPPREEIAAAIVDFARRTLENGEIPVFFAYSLGKAQEAIAILGNGGVPVTLHHTVHTMANVYQECGMNLPAYELHDEERFAGDTALIWPPSAARLRDRICGRRVRTASLTGWSIGGGVYRPNQDQAFPLSDHADFPSLLRYIELAQPKKVLLTHGYKGFTAFLRKRGVHAEYLEECAQLTLF
jgi:Cft2 family RNA processing exonuclease